MGWKVRHGGGGGAYARAQGSGRVGFLRRICGLKGSGIRDIGGL